MPKEIKSNLIEDDTVKLLNKFQILKELTLNEIRLLLGKEESDYQKRIARLIRYDAEEIVIREGDFDSWIFWVVQGEYAVVKDDVVVTVFDEPGDVFGEMSILDEDSRSASVVSLIKGVCVSIDMSVLDMITNETLKNKIKQGIHQLKTIRLNLTTRKLVAEKQKMVDQGKEILNEKLKLNEREKKLARWEEELTEREKRFKQYLVKHQLTEEDINLDTDND